jgi:protein-S-isoprenylcysteine O-methyltransferase Ste14
MRASNLTILIAVPTVAGVDLGRVHGLALDVPFAAVGFGCFTVSTILLNWAMAVNPHFEPTVRVQTDRDHAVISTGPYRIVRHPGYLAGILYALSIPLIIGSALTFIPVGIYTVLFIVRTSLEDRTLQNELDGCAEYARRVRYKLISVLW